MALISLSDLTWITLDPVAEFCELNEEKKLSVLCAEKLVTDVSLISKDCHKLPKPIHLLLLSTAIKKNRILSITQLVKSCPMEMLELPIPQRLKSVCAILKCGGRHHSEFKSELNSFRQNSVTLLSAFMDLVLKDDSNSKLVTLDLGFLPISWSIITYFLKKLHYKEKPLTKTYALKCCVTIETSNELCVLSKCVRRDGVLPGFSFIVTGVYFYNNHFPDVHVLNLLDLLSVPNLQLIDFSFAIIRPRIEPFLMKLQSFKAMKYLNLSYYTGAKDTGSFCNFLAVTLSHLTDLKRLVLKGLHLKGKVNDLFLKYCRKNSHQNCCLVHSGSLEYLDISACRLTDDDLPLFGELALTGSLNYLNVAYNSFDARRAFDALLFLKSSLYALDIEHALKHPNEPDLVLPFSLFTKLKYLNVTGLQITEFNRFGLQEELQKMPGLKILEMDTAARMNFPTAFAEKYFM